MAGRIPMPSPNGTNCEGLYLPSRMAFDSLRGLEGRVTRRKPKEVSVYDLFPRLAEMKVIP